jgi:23S rRNA pseudouridine2604 synthase
MTGKTLKLPKKAPPAAETPQPAAKPVPRRVKSGGLPPTKRSTSPSNASRSTPNTERSTRAAPRPTPNTERPTSPTPRSTPNAERPTSGATRSTPEDGRVRVSKLMSERGLCSRREADAYIERGWVFVDGEKVTELGTRIFATQTITLSRDAQTAQLQSVTILLHKPIGFVSGQPEPGYTPAVTLVVPDHHWKGDESKQRFSPVHLRGLAPAGRLDIDSTGLIVFTQDGRIAKKLIGEDSGVEKEYLVRVEGQLSEGGLKKLNHGLSLDGKALKPAKVSWQNEDQLRFVLREGKKRQIRRMCEMVGLKVVGLKRIRIGSVVLGKLPVGQWRYLREDERF